VFFAVIIVTGHGRRTFDLAGHEGRQTYKRYFERCSFYLKFVGFLHGSIVFLGIFYTIYNYILLIGLFKV